MAIRIFTTHTLVILGLIALLASCRSSRPRQMTATEAMSLPETPAASDSGRREVTASEVPETLALADAVDLARRRNPGLAAARSGLQAAEARFRQSGRLPNPGMELSVGEYDRAGAGFDSAESEIAISQPFELGGKRKARMRIAQTERDLEEWGLASEELAVYAETKQRFMTVLANRKRLELAEAILDISQKTSSAVADRVASGKEAPLQRSKAEAELVMARVDVEQARNRLEASRSALAEMWGGSAGDFKLCAGSLSVPEEDIATLEELNKDLNANPAVLRWNSTIEHSKALLASEKAHRIPDVELTAGLEQFEEDGSESFALGLGFPLPIFDRNTDNITAARRYMEQAHARRDAALASLKTELASLHADLRSSRKRVAAYQEKVIPAMEAARNAASEGYRHGKFGFLEMLDAQRGLFDAQRDLIDAQEAFHHIHTAMEKITGNLIKKKG